MKTLKIEADVWHASLYMQGMRLWKTFSSSRRDIEVSPYTNICQYVRVLFFALASIFAYISVIGYLGATFIYYPSIYFGVNYWEIIALILASIVAFIVFIVVLCFLVDSVPMAWQKMTMWFSNKKPTAKHIEDFIEGTPNRPSMLRVAKQYVRDHSNDFCSAIQIVLPETGGVAENNHPMAGISVHTATKKEGDSFTPISTITTVRIKFLPVWWKLALLSLFSALFLHGLNKLHASDSEVTAVWEGECSVITWDEKEARFFVTLLCNNKKIVVSDTETLLSYVNDKVKPYCFEDKNNELYCRNRDKKRMKKY